MMCKNCDAAFAEYKKVRAPALTKYEKACDAAFAEYKKAYDPAWAKYLNERDNCLNNKKCDKCKG